MNRARSALAWVIMTKRSLPRARAQGLELVEVVEPADQAGVDVGPVAGQYLGLPPAQGGCRSTGPGRRGRSPARGPRWRRCPGWSRRPGVRRPGPPGAAARGAAGPGVVDGVDQHPARACGLGHLVERQRGGPQRAHKRPAVPLLPPAALPRVRYSAVSTAT